MPFLPRFKKRKKEKAPPEEHPPPEPPPPPPPEPDVVEPPPQYKDPETFFGPLYPELICYGCTKLFTSPYLLPCDDSVCETCLQKMKSEMRTDKRGHVSVKCPICKSDFHFDSMRDVRFPENYLLQNIVTEQKKKISASKSTLSSADVPVEEMKIFCQLCDEKFPRSSIRRCITCSLNFCEKCLKDIHGNKAFLSHTLSDSSFVTDTRIKCYLHPENEIILYCTTDHMLLCDECYNASHECHVTRSIHEAFQTETKDVLALASNFHKAVESSERNIKKLNALKTELDDTESEIEQSLFKEFLTLHEEIQLQQMYICERLKNETVKKKLHIDHFVDSASKSVYKMEGLDHFITEALKQANPAVFLQMANPIKARIRKCTLEIVEPSHTLSINPLKDFHFDFSFLRSQIANLHLKILQPDPVLFHIDEENCQADHREAQKGESREIQKGESREIQKGERREIHKGESRETQKGGGRETQNVTFSVDNNENWNAQFNSCTTGEDDVDCVNNSTAPSENDNNHQFESAYTTCSAIPTPPNVACPSENAICAAKDQNIQCVEDEAQDWEFDERATCPYPKISPPLKSTRKLVTPSQSDCQPCQPNNDSESYSSTNLNSSGCTEKEKKSWCVQDLIECRRNKPCFASNRACDYKTENRSNSSPPVFGVICEETAAVQEQHSSNSDASPCSSDEAPVRSGLPGKPTIYEHTADANSAKIYWARLTQDEIVKYYEVQLQEIFSSADSHTFPRDQSGLFSGIKREVFKARELNANSEYLFRVRAVNHVGRGEWSDPYKVLNRKDQARFYWSPLSHRKLQVEKNQNWMQGCRVLSCRTQKVSHIGQNCLCCPHQLHHISVSLTECPRRCGSIGRTTTFDYISSSSNIPAIKSLSTQTCNAVKNKKRFNTPSCCYKGFRVQFHRRWAPP